MTRFAGRRAIVTGAAGGIGAAIVARLLEEGAEVAAIDRKFEGAGETPAPRCVKADLRKPAAARSAVAEALRLLGTSGIVILASILRSIFGISRRSRSVFSLRSSTLLASQFGHLRNAST